jgi:predicted nuclease with TOPRIM domain
MPPTIETDLKEVLGAIQGELKEIRNDLTDLKVSQAEIRGDLANLRTEQTLIREDVKDLKGRASAQIWALIVTIIGAIVAAVVKFGFFQNP